MALTEMVTGRSAVLPLYDPHHAGTLVRSDDSELKRRLGGDDDRCAVLALMVLKLTNAQYLALQATTRGEVYRTHSGSVYTLTGPGGSQPLWAVARAGLIADPPDAKKHRRYQMVLTSSGTLALSEFVQKKKR
jgi:hypothetical protein